MNDRLKLYVDVDSTIADTISLVLKLHAKETGEIVGINEIQDYKELHAIGGLSKFMEYYRMAWIEYWNKIQMTEPNLPNIFKNLRRIFEIIFVTDRPKETMNGLYNWLEVNGLVECDAEEEVLRVDVRERVEIAISEEAILVDDYPFLEFREYEEGDEVIYDKAIEDLFVEGDEVDLDSEFWLWNRLRIYLRPWNYYDALKAELDFTWDRWRELLPGDERFVKTQDELLFLHARKNSDYSYGYPLANLMSSSQMGIPPWIGVAIRLGDKMARLRSLAYKRMKGVPQMIKEETVKDVFDDIAVYAILGRILFKENM